MAKTTRNHRIVIFALGLAIAIVVGVMALVNRPGSSDMPGMDMSAAQMPTSSPTSAAKSGDMPGMDMPAKVNADEPAPDRPLAPVLGVFGGGAAAVMLSAGMMRRRDLVAKRVKDAARAARRSQK